MRLPLRKPNRLRVRIVSRRTSEFTSGKKLYEIQPKSYAGPWDLPVGTVLEVVSEPRTKETP